MEGLGAALLFVSHWGCSLLPATVREKGEGRMKEREKKRKGRKRKNGKKSNLKIYEK
jgi:hypothetical protein